MSAFRVKLFRFEYKYGDPIAFETEINVWLAAEDIKQVIETGAAFWHDHFVLTMLYEEIGMGP